MSTLRIATRQSRLALTQTRWVAARIQEHEPGLKVEEVQVVTEGDRILDKPLATIGGKGLFVSEVEQAIVDGRADLAVHSMKDIPSALAEGLHLACVPERHDARDVLLTAAGDEIDALEAGSRIGTSSLRRASQLKAHRPDLAFATLRGNVDTRLRKLDEGKYAAIVLAKAGLARMDLLGRPHWVIPTEICLPAAGQGALGLEARKDDKRVADLVKPLAHFPTAVEIEAERTIIERLEANCKVPVAAYAQLGEGHRLTVRAMVGSLDGTTVLSAGSDCWLSGETATYVGEAQALGNEVADSLVERGARDLIRDAIASVERTQKKGNGSGGHYGKWR